MMFFNLPEGINSMYELEQMGGMGDTAAWKHSDLCRRGGRGSWIGGV